MPQFDPWASATDETRTLLLHAATELTSGMAEQSLVALDTWAHNPFRRNELTHTYARAGAAFLACLSLPDDRQDLQDQLPQLVDQLLPFFQDERIQTVLVSATIGENRPRSIDQALIETAWAGVQQPASETDALSWRKGLGIAEAVESFVEWFERGVQERPDLEIFLLAAHLRRGIDQLDTEVANEEAEEMNSLLQTVESLAPSRVRTLATELARVGYSARGLEVQDDVTGSVIVTAADTAVFVADEGVLAWLFNQLPDHEHVLTRYRADLRRAYTHHPLHGLAMPRIDGSFLDPATVQVPMDRTFVRLRPVTTNAHPPGAPIPPREAVAKHTRLVILGETGSGKSTLLHHLAWADVAGPGPLPLLIPLRQIDRPLRGRDDLLQAALDCLTTSKDRVERRRVRSAMEHEIAAGRVRWLWDGLEQVRRHREQVMDALAELAAEGYPMVITCHPHGYQPIPGCETIYEVAPLTSEEIASFVQLWFSAFAAAQGRSEEEQESWTAERFEWFRQQLEAHPELAGLAQTPLTLSSLVALAADVPCPELPARRKDLYDRYVRRLLAMARDLSSSANVAEGTEDVVEPENGSLSILHQAGLYLHQVARAHPEAAAYPLAIKALAEEEGQGLGLLRRFQTSTRVKAAIHLWEEAGALERYPLAGEEYLAFRHPLLREYGGARALAARHQDDPAELWAELTSHLADPAWSHVIPLTLAYLDDATPLLQRLAEAHDGDQPSRPLRLAAQALIEGASATPTVEQQILDGLKDLACASPAEATRSRALTDLLTLGRLGEPYAIQQLVMVASGDQVDEATRSRAAQALDQMECTDELLALSRDTRADPVVRRGAAQALRQLGRTQDLAQAWDAMAKDNQVDPLVRVELAQNLSHLGERDAAAEILFELVRAEGVELEARQQAARALGRLDRPDVAMEAWLALALDGAAPGDLRQEAAEALDGLHQDEAAVRAWQAIAGDERLGLTTRRVAAESLARLGETDFAAETWLGLALKGEATLETRREAAEVLTSLGHTRKVGRVWLALAQDERMAPRARKEAAYNLIYSDHVEAAVDVLLALVRDAGVEFQIRKEAGEALGHLGQIEDATEAWLALAHDVSVGGKTRMEAIEMLQQLGCTSDASQALIDLAQDRSVNQWIRVEATKAVAQLGHIEEAADLSLVLANEDGLAWWVREGAIRSMGQMGRAAATPQRLASLQQIATDNQVANEVRRAAQRAIQRLRASQR